MKSKTRPRLKPSDKRQIAHWVSEGIFSYAQMSLMSGIKISTLRNITRDMGLEYIYDGRGKRHDRMYSADRVGLMHTDGNPVNYAG